LRPPEWYTRVVHMPLPMTRPFKHPKTGIYWLRKRVPAHLQELVGKVEEKLSLKTREPGEAKKRHAVALAALEQRWENLAAGPRRLTEREAHDLARPLAVEWLALYEANPSQQDFWPIGLGGVLWADPPVDLSLSTADLLRATPEDSKRTQLRDWCFRQADQLLTANGLRAAAEEDRKVLAVAVSAAMQRASVQLERLSRGELIEPQATTAAPAQRPATLPLVRFDDLLKGWIAETRPAKKTQYEWTRVVGQLRARHRRLSPGPSLYRSVQRSRGTWKFTTCPGTWARRCRLMLGISIWLPVIAS